MARLALKRPVVTYICDHYNVSQRRACRIVGLNRSVLYYQTAKPRREDHRARMRELSRPAFVVGTEGCTPS